MTATLRERLSEVFKRTKPGAIVKREEQGREAVVNELRRGYDQLLDTMESVRGHMEDQSRRSDRVLEVIESLPEVLRAIPESGREQSKTLACLAESLRIQNQSTDELTRALGGLADVSRQQEQALAGMNDRLNETLARGAESQQAVVAGIDQMSEAVRGVTRDQRDGRAVLAEVADHSRRQQKQMMAMTGVSWALAVVALCVAGWVAVMAAQIGSTPITGRSVEPAATDTQTAAQTPVEPAPQTTPTPVTDGPSSSTPVAIEPTDLPRVELSSPLRLAPFGG